MSWTKDQERVFRLLLVRKMDEIKHDILLEMTNRKVEGYLDGDLPESFERADELMSMAKKWGLISYEDSND